VLAGTLLHKKRDKTLLSNYRLISVLETDLRWRATALLDKMMPELNKFIFQEQTGFIKSRQISDNIMGVMMAIEELRSTEQQSMILALDQEKAYDRVSWDWLFHTLKHIGIPDEIINDIKFSYYQPAVKIGLNKHILSPLTLKCGVLQGDPLSVLLYVISIQPLLYALKDKTSITVEFEGHVAKLFSRTHADDLILFLANQSEFIEAMETVKLYCSISNAKTHPRKATAIFHGEPDDTDWRQETEFKREEEDYTHMGCPMRADGQAPEQALQILLSKIQRSCHTFEINEHPLRTRIELLNNYILSKIWYATQLCPVHYEFSKDLQRTITNFAFRTIRAPIEFNLVCYPKKLGGLGLLNPEKMMLALNGRAVARMLSDNGELGKVFKLQLLRTMDEHGGSIFRLLAKAKWSATQTNSTHMPLEASPFYYRIHDTLLELKLGHDIDWEKYSDYEILSLPYDIPEITGEHGTLLGKRVRPSLTPLQICLLKDILIYRPTYSNKFQFRNRAEGLHLIEDRMIIRDPQIAEDREFHFRIGQRTGPYKTNILALGDLRRY